MLLVDAADRAIQDRLASDLAEVEARFAAELLSDLPCVNDLVTHIERYRGKMLRPMLVLLSGMAAGKDAGPGQPPITNDALRITATVVEMVHMATLVHDDVLDEAEVRRKGATINQLTGNEAAVMLGDYLISHAYRLCSSLRDAAVSLTIADATNVVCEGELLQLANRDNWSLDEGTYFEMIRRKTAVLTGACCRLAGMISGRSEAVQEKMYLYGEKLGIAFQIADDLLDLLGDESTVGKTLGRDLQKGKATLPVIHYLNSLRTPQRESTVQMLRSLRSTLHIDDADGGESLASTINPFRKQLLAAGSVEYARQTARRLIDEAKVCLSDLPPTAARQLLLDMADTVITRKA